MDKAKPKNPSSGNTGWKYKPGIIEFVFLLCFGSCLVISFFYWAENAWMNQRLASEGQLTIGEIIAVETIASSSPRGQTRPNSIQVSYHFTVDNIDFYYSTYVGLESGYYSRHVGDSVTIRYLPSNPNISKIEGQALNIFGGTGIAIGVIVLILLTILIGNIIVKRNRN